LKSEKPVSSTIRRRADARVQPPTLAKTRRTPVNGASDLAHVALVFDNNALARDLFGRFDEHLAIIEREFAIDAVARGNEVDLKGPADAVAQARTVLDHLYAHLGEGKPLTGGDVEGAARMARTGHASVHVPTEQAGGKLSLSGISTTRKTVQARTATQDAYIRAMDRVELVFGAGPAGTGKTYLAVAYAASLLERGAVDRIILSRPAVEAGERLGFLPGDMKEKVDPYLRPLYDALYDMMPGDKVERAITTGVIEIAPLAFMRGRTLANAAIILDEAQNTTSMQMKMFLTRLGENSKMIITGDPSQIDLPGGQVSGLVEALGILRDVQGIATVTFTSADVVRHRLVARIVEAYDQAAKGASQAASSPAKRQG
jgi:phosphate starvation-inducible PhoH-like protein